MISVIIPCYKQDEYLQDALDSVSQQSTDEAIEVIVVKDVVGLSKARNIGVRQSKGDRIICLDADDKLEPNYIEECLKHCTDIVYTDAHNFGTKKSIESYPPFDEEILKDHNYIHCAAMYKREVFDKVGGYDESMVHGWEDYDFWLSALECGYTFEKCSTTFLWWRRKEESMTSQIGEYMADIQRYIREKHNVIIK